MNKTKYKLFNATIVKWLHRNVLPRSQRLKRDISDLSDLSWHLANMRLACYCSISLLFTLSLNFLYTVVPLIGHSQQRPSSLIRPQIFCRYYYQYREGLLYCIKWYCFLPWQLASLHSYLLIDWLFLSHTVSRGCIVRTTSSRAVPWASGLSTRCSVPGTTAW